MAMTGVVDVHQPVESRPLAIHFPKHTEEKDLALFFVALCAV